MVVAGCALAPPPQHRDVVNEALPKGTSIPPSWKADANGGSVADNWLASFNDPLLDAIVAAKPEIDHKHAHSPEELKQTSLTHLRDAVALLQTKATPQELDEYKRFVVNLANRVASAHREHGRGGDPVSDTEKAAIAEITEALG